MVSVNIKFTTLNMKGDKPASTKLSKSVAMATISRGGYYNLTGCFKRYYSDVFPMNNDTLIYFDNQHKRLTKELALLEKKSQAYQDLKVKRDNNLAAFLLLEEILKNPLHPCTIIIPKHQTIDNSTDIHTQLTEIY